MAQCSFSPPPEAKWLIGTHHKTGTVLNEELLSHVWGLGPTVVKHCDEDAVKHLEQCVGEPGGASVVFDHHVHVPSASEWGALQERAHKDLRAAHWVRDPLELVLSAFFCAPPISRISNPGSPSRLVADCTRIPSNTCTISRAPSQQ